jgi:hypothetical protein
MSVHIDDHWTWLAYPLEVALVDAPTVTLAPLRIHGTHNSGSRSDEFPMSELTRLADGHDNTEAVARRSNIEPPQKVEPHRLSDEVI